MSLGDLNPGWTRIAAGVYDDGLGGMHLDLAELLDAAGYEDNEANREAVINAARDVFGPTGPVIVVEAP
ncbi:MAG TPA: hypothetical protein VGH66_00505 [Acidimicrobiales bacterium]|jgi:hypothetical protein